MVDAVRELLQWLHGVPHLALYLVLGWSAYLLFLGGWIVLQKREPVATVSWLLGLAAASWRGSIRCASAGSGSGRGSTCACTARSW